MCVCRRTYNVRASQHPKDFGQYRRYSGQGEETHIALIPLVILLVARARFNGVGEVRRYRLAVLIVLQLFRKQLPLEINQMLNRHLPILDLPKIHVRVIVVLVLVVPPVAAATAVPEIVVRGAREVTVRVREAKAEPVFAREHIKERDALCIRALKSTRAQACLTVSVVEHVQQLLGARDVVAPRAKHARELRCDAAVRGQCGAQRLRGVDEVVGQRETEARGDGLDFVRHVSVPRKHGCVELRVSGAVVHSGEVAEGEVGGTAGEVRWENDDDGREHAISFLSAGVY